MLVNCVTRETYKLTNDTHNDAVAYYYNAKMKQCDEKCGHVLTIYYFILFTGQNQLKVIVIGFVHQLRRLNRYTRYSAENAYIRRNPIEYTMAIRRFN